MGSKLFSDANNIPSADEKSTGNSVSTNARVGNVTLFRPAFDINGALDALAAKAETLANKAELESAKELMSNANPLLPINSGSVGA